MISTLATSTMMPRPKSIYIIDGGMGTELERRGIKLGDYPMWSSGCLFANETTAKAVSDVHLDYLRAGADVLTTCTYQMSEAGCASLVPQTTEPQGEGGNGSDLSVSLHDVVVKAFMAIQEALKRYRAESAVKSPIGLRAINIVASLGPYGSVLPGGEEFKGNYQKSQAELLEFHTPRVKAFMTWSTQNAPSTGLDINMFAFETFPRLDEALVVASIAQSHHRKCWITFTMDPKDFTRTSAGDGFIDVVREIRMKYSDTVMGIGINCGPPAAANDWLDFMLYKAEWSPVLTATAHIKSKFAIVMYPNSGEIFVGGGEWSAPPIDNSTPLNMYASDWKSKVVSSGARPWSTGANALFVKDCFLVGGCCRTTPDIIRSITDAVGQQTM